MPSSEKNLFPVDMNYKKKMHVEKKKCGLLSHVNTANLECHTGKGANYFNSGSVIS